ncbi:hypothetical protein WICMUC_000788 [Wickerhamomyces mucosus]|uniref:Mediator of RNA polymerase II transcription subunit 5 n=1 Tax=Wickerhamomyces mucosus TaxID=1378264 RepID=A0A9P8PWD4_9ASCO|nr:hypothetical protein WICMUC_000788 [Wickerhamomyces mucosus]
MTTNFQLHTLVEFCLKKRTTPLVFQSLLKQINHKQEISVQDVTDLLKKETDLDPLLLIYISTSSLGDNTTNLKLSVILNALHAATSSNQLLILSSLASQLRILTDENLPFTSYEVSDVISSFINYLKFLSSNKSEDVQILSSSAELSHGLLTKLQHESSVQQLLQSNNEFFVSYIDLLRSKSLLIAEDLELSFNKSIKRTSISASFSTSTNPNVPSHLSYIKINKSAKTIWLSNAIETWSTHNDNFIQSFEQLVKIKTNQNVLNDLISASFEGYVIASNLNYGTSITTQNWKLFLTKRLPVLIGQLHLKNVESSLTNSLNLVEPKISQAIKQSTFDGLDNNNNNNNNNNSINNQDSNFDDMFSSFPSTVTDIRHDILRSLIALQLLPQSAYASILKQDATADTRSLPSNDEIRDSLGNVVDLKETLARTLTDINVEFTPLEDSGLLEFLQLIPNMEGTKQAEISRLILETIELNIKTDDVGHLYRLALALASSKDSLVVILFHLSPSVVIKPLLNLLDTWSTSDDMNFQEAYASFSCIFLLLLLIVKQYNIPLEQLITLRDSTDKESFCIKYITSLGTSVQFDTLDSRASEVFAGWVSALFDSGGISDDLMRLSTVQECYELFPLIFQQAFIGCKQNLSDIETIKGGLEYFLQPFLLGTLIGIFAWAENSLWKFQDVDILSNLLKTLINQSELSGEALYIHNIVLSIYGPNLLKVFKAIEKSRSSSAISGHSIDPILITNLESSFDIENVKILNMLDFDTSRTFDKSLTKDNESLIHIFNNQLHLLLNWNQQTQIVDYDAKLFKTTIKIIGEEALLENLLHEINQIQLLNLKSSANLIELSTYLIATNYITESNKSQVLKCLKTEQLIRNVSFSFKPIKRLLKVLIKRKKDCDLNVIEGEILKLFYEKLIETIETLIPLS